MFQKITGTTYKKVNTVLFKTFNKKNGFADICEDMTSWNYRHPRCNYKYTETGNDNYIYQ